MTVFHLPDLGEGLDGAEIVRWHVKTGDHVNADDPMLAVETAKAIVEVPSPFSGVIKALHGTPGDTVAAGALLVEFELNTPNTVVSANTTQADRISAVPAPTPQRTPAASEGERLKGPRRAMAQSMATSRDTVTSSTLFDDADLHSWQPEQDITCRILRAIAQGCTAEPGLNAWFDGENLYRQVLSQIDVAIAVDTPEGLVAPVIRNIRDRPVAELRRDVDRLKRDTDARTVSADDLRNFTFMLSNFGMIAGRYATPVVVPPAVAILGCGRLSHDVIATQTGHIEAHLRMPLSLTFDHRCVTGGESARFLAAVIRDLQKGN